MPFTRRPGIAPPGAGSSSPAAVLGASSDQFCVLGSSTTSSGVVGTSTTGMGVSGESASGAGVFGMSSSGPGVIAHITTLDHSLLNNAPNAMVFVTRVWGGAGFSTANITSLLSVFYNGTSWAIFREDGVGMPFDTRFNVLVISRSSRHVAAVLSPEPRDPGPAYGR